MAGVSDVQETYTGGDTMRCACAIASAYTSADNTGVKHPAASSGALKRKLSVIWGNLSPKPPNKDAIPPHRKQWGILSCFREVVADNGYDWPQTHRWLQSQKIVSGILRKRLGRGRPRRSRQRRPMIERKFAELSVHHRLTRARYWGLANLTIQTAMTAFVVNCKCLVRILRPGGGAWRGPKYISNAIESRG